MHMYIYRSRQYNLQFYVYVRLWCLLRIHRKSKCMADHHIEMNFGFGKDPCKNKDYKELNLNKETGNINSCIETAANSVNKINERFLSE